MDHNSILDFTWEPIKNISQIYYLNIDAKFTLKEQPEAHRIAFWNELYQKYENNLWKFGKNVMYLW